MKQRRTPIQLSPSERQAVAQARQALALAVPQIRDTNLKRSLHGALCDVERALDQKPSLVTRAMRRAILQGKEEE